MKKFLIFIFCGTLYSQVTNLDSLYYSYSEIKDSLYAWQTKFGQNPHPFSIYQNSIVYQLDSIGVSSNEELPIYAVKLSMNVNEEEDEPKVLILGQCHAEEIYGVELSMALIRWFLYPEETNWGNNELPLFLYNLEIWIVPTHNPEGLNVVHGYEDDEGNWYQDISFRKNKTDVNLDGNFNFTSFYPDQIAGNDSDGVDLNRNYGLNWMFGDDKYELNLQSCPSNQAYSSNYDYYKGPSPFSESEVVAVKDFVQSKQFLFSIAYHSSRSGCVSERVIYPWAWGWIDSNGNEIVDSGEARTSPDFESIKPIAENIASLIEKEGGGYYNPRPQKSRNGNAHDWIYANTGCIQFLIEVGSSNIQPLDQDLINSTIDNNRKGLFYLLKESIPSEANDTRHITGIVTDASTGNPIEGVRYKVLEFSSEVLESKRTNSVGRYHNILPLGNYHIEFLSDGYQKQIVEVNQNNILNIELIPLIQKQITFKIDNYDQFSNEVLVDLIDSNDLVQSYSLTSESTTINLFQKKYNLVATSESIIPYNIVLDSLITDDIVLKFQSKNIASENLISSTNWSSDGIWIIQDNKLLSQQEEYYSNNLVSAITLDNIIDLETDRLIAIELNLRYELEWDRDSIFFNIKSANSVFNLATWTNQNWINHSEYYFITLDKDEVYDIEFILKSDSKLDYRGIEISDLRIHITPCTSLGDLNYDTSWNIMDIILLVNCVLSNSCIDQASGCEADLNLDGEYNILDITILADCVLMGNCDY